MQCYSLDRTKPVEIIKMELENNQILIHGYAKTIQCTENQSSFGSMKGLWLLDPRRLKLTKEEKRELRLARFHNNKDQECKVYARALSQLQKKRVYKKNG